MESNSNDRPAIIERIAPNRYRYNYDIHQVEREAEPNTSSEEGDGIAITHGYDYQHIEFCGQPDRATITRLVLREEKSETQEFELVNRYNAVMLGIENDETAIDDYKAWLTRVAEVKAMVAADLTEAATSDNN